MSNEPLTKKQAIARSLGIQWAQVAIGQMQALHSAGMMSSDDACELVVRVVLSVAGSVQATADATHFRDFNRERVSAFLDEILAGQPMAFNTQTGAVGPAALN